MFNWLERSLGIRRGRRSTRLSQNISTEQQQQPFFRRSSSLTNRSSPTRYVPDDQHIVSTSFPRSRSVSFRPLYTAPPPSESPPPPESSPAPSARPSLSLELSPSSTLSLPLMPAPMLSLPVPSRRPPPQGEIFLETLVVFWDMENCRVSRRFIPRLVYHQLYQNLSAALAGRIRFQKLIVKGFGEAGFLGFDAQQILELRDNFVEYTDTLRRDETDGRLIQELYSWVYSNGPFNPVGLIVISGDLDFQGPLVQVRSFGHITINISNAKSRNEAWEKLLKHHYLDFIIGWSKVRP